MSPLLAAEYFSRIQAECLLTPSLLQFNKGQVHVDLPSLLDHALPLTWHILMELLSDIQLKELVWGGYV